MKRLSHPSAWITCVVVLWVFGGFILPKVFSPSAEGSFGDQFGAVNALFAGLAFFGLIYAISLQRQELELQRRELELTREELQKSAMAQGQTADAVASQVRVASLSSKLSAISSLLQSCNDQIVGIETRYSNAVGSATRRTRDEERRHLDKRREELEQAAQAILAELEQAQTK